MSKIKVNIKMTATEDSFYHLPSHGPVAGHISTCSTYVTA